MALARQTAAWPVIRGSHLSLFLRLSVRTTLGHRGLLTKWGSGRTKDGRANLLYARLGPTLVTIVGAVSYEELLRVADSLQRTPSSALML